MNIELAPTSENKMTYNEAVLYCAFYRQDGLGDWRLPTFNEYITNHSIGSVVWYFNDPSPGIFYTIPVRDV